MRKVHILTITHQSLSVEELKHFVINTDNGDLSEQLHAIKSGFELDELLYVNTCNRIIFLIIGDLSIDNDWIKALIRRVNPDMDNEVLSRLPKYVDYYQGAEAINHIYRVASSVDSLVVGEREILRQFRSAYQSCLEMGLTGDFIRLIEQHTVATAKYILTHTKIGERPVSVASLAFQKLKQSSLTTDSKILIIGSGETNRNVARFLNKHGYDNTEVFNRSISNAIEITEILGCGEAHHLSDLVDYTEGFDGIIVCTGANKSVVDLKTYKSIVGRDDARKVLVDLSVPRDIHEDVVDQYDVDYIDIESIRCLAEENMAFRRQEVKAALEIIDSRADDFEEIIQIRNIEVALNSVPREIKTIKEKALTEVYKDNLASLDDNAKSLLIEMMNYMEKKCIAVPMKVARENLVNV